MASQNKTFPKIETVDLKDIPLITALNSITDINSKYHLNELNNILEFLHYPKLQADTTQTNQLISLSNILGKLEEDLGVEGVYKTSEIIDKSMEIEEIQKTERECDILEISLANAKVEYDEVQEYKKYKMEDLEMEYQVLNQEINDYQFETSNKKILNQVYSFLAQEPVNKKILNIFYYIKQLPEYELIIEKERLKEEILEDEDTCLGQIFKDLVVYGQISVRKIEEVLGLDKVDILKIVYGLTNNEIVEFDKEEGLLYLKK